MHHLLLHVQACSSCTAMAFTLAVQSASCPLLASQPQSCTLSLLQLVAPTVALLEGGYNLLSTAKGTEAVVRSRGGSSACLGSCSSAPASTAFMQHGLMHIVLHCNGFLTQ